ncbi:unnamed protein product [Lactuca saligna]|uniref:Uncharacterized protein n=1 Tax=Lactuca saligna TaxID=75948 RepID=A0AA35YFF9_LACSI|nr:unnamed protein product [Lactuca saligna]
MYPQSVTSMKQAQRAMMGGEILAASGVAVRSPTRSSSAVETTTTYIASLWCPLANLTPQVAIVTTTPHIIATQQIEIPVSRQQSFPNTSGTETWILHNIQPQPQYSSMVYIYITMVGLSDVPLFIQQLPIFNPFVQQTPGSILELS